MKRTGSIHALLRRAASDLQKVEGEYQASLNRQQVADELRVDIKNLCENLRSVLDYVAHEIRETHCPTADPGARFYFPILGSLAEFTGQAGKWYPDLKAAAPRLWAYLEGLQPYHPEYAWLGSFNRVNNANKHGNLVEQTRRESAEVRVSFPGGQVTWRPESVTFGTGVYIGGVPVDPRTQLPVPHPSQSVERIVWVDFRFQGEDVSALGLLRQAVAGVGKIVEDVEQWM